MAKRIPSLNSLRVLAACVRHGNFSRAASELGITPTAVSQRIRALEAEMGVTLFRRHGPQLTATDRAKALGQRLEQAFALVHSGVDECRRVKQPLRVTCAPTFAARWLAPRLETYHALAGADSIVLDINQDISAVDSFDVAIRNGVGPWPGVNCVKLMPEQRTPLVSPKLAAGRVTIRHLLELPLIPDPGWSDWFKLAGIASARPKFVATRYPNYELESQAATQGIGVALLSPILFSELLTHGLLAAPFPWVLESPASYWLLWAGDASECHFVRWIRAQFSAGAAQPQANAATPQLA